MREGGVRTRRALAPRGPPRRPQAVERARDSVGISAIWRVRREIRAMTSGAGRRQTS